MQTNMHVNRRLKFHFTVITANLLLSEHIRFYGFISLVCAYFCFIVIVRVERITLFGVFILHIKIGELPD